MEEDNTVTMSVSVPMPMHNKDAELNTMAMLEYVMNWVQMDGHADQIDLKARVASRIGFSANTRLILLTISQAWNC